MSMPLKLSTDDVQTAEYKTFIVDYFQENKDMVYHFYANPIDTPFIENFHLNLEKAFASILPDNADVRAQFIENYEMKNFERSFRPEDKPYSSFWVRVKELADNPMAESFLCKRVFSTLNELTR